ncbi:hypothetical protein [Nitrosomonas sp. Nm132]|jgi:hypothetical protein|uniref:hypothetical protein n=1 Tax=Nitrosomonas sp. Nm132 TaxID=1881053 RepID=UPI00087F588B|nr:hypothetical protein [Nitrosomonas sp. Nm132]SDG83637.1 hypothetical protein SAMN05428952_100165 [Nitrosomonas sp. Nm132]
MRNLFLSLSFAVMGSALSLSSHADMIAVVKGHAVFMATGSSLAILPSPSDGQLSCSYGNGVFSPGSSAGLEIPLPGATDIKLVGNDLYIATLKAPAGLPIPGAAENSYVKYDVSACLPDVPFTPSIARADLAAGELVIPCVLVDGQEYNVVMNQRGNSMNWEVIFADSGCQ